MEHGCVCVFFSLNVVIFLFVFALLFSGFKELGGKLDNKNRAS